MAGEHSCVIKGTDSGKNGNKEAWTEVNVYAILFNLFSVSDVLITLYSQCLSNCQ